MLLYESLVVIPFFFAHFVRIFTLSMVSIRFIMHRKHRQNLKPLNWCPISAKTHKFAILSPSLQMICCCTIYIPVQRRFKQGSGGLWECFKEVKRCFKVLHCSHRSYSSRRRAYFFIDYDKFWGNFSFGCSLFVFD